MNRIYWITDLANGKLGMMPRPRGNDWLEEDIKRLSLQDVDVLVSLLEKNEITELGLSNEEAICIQYGIRFFNYPIIDRGVPSSKSAFFQLLEKIGAGLSEHKKVVVHCRIGIGRTSLLCASLLLNIGFNRKDVFEYLSEIRTLRVPDTAAQENWVKELFG